MSTRTSGNPIADLEKEAPQFKPPQFDEAVERLADACVNYSMTHWDVRNAIRKSLQAAYLDGVIAALKDRARSQGIDLS